MWGAWRSFSRLAPDARDLLFVWAGSIYAIATAVTVKAVHDDIGILVPAALLSAVGIASLHRFRTAAMSLLAGFVSLQLATLTLPEPMLGARVGTFGWAGVVTPFPRMEDWNIETALRSIGTGPARVAVISDHIFINGTVFQFYTMRDRLTLQVSPCWRLGAKEADHADLSQFEVVIAKSDLAWIRRKVDGCFTGPNGREEYAALLRRIDDHPTGFELRREVPLADGSSLLVFTAPGVVTVNSAGSPPVRIRGTL